MLMVTKYLMREKLLVRRVSRQDLAGVSPRYQVELQLFLRRSSTGLSCL